MYLSFACVFARVIKFCRDKNPAIYFRGTKGGLCGIPDYNLSLCQNIKMELSKTSSNTLVKTALNYVRV